MRSPSRLKHAQKAVGIRSKSVSVSMKARRGVVVGDMNTYSGDV
jgi:hypothetical protein